MAKISYHVAKLGLGIASAYTIFKWKIRQAKGTFKETLLNEGIPEDVASTLAESYDESNRRMLSLVDTGLASFSRQPNDKDEES